MKTATKLPRLNLKGADGNAFNLLGLAHAAAKKAGWTEERWREVQREAMSGDYSNLLITLGTHFDIRRGR